jgi:hypothetical protein
MVHKVQSSESSGTPKDLFDVPSGDQSSAAGSDTEGTVIEFCRCAILSQPWGACATGL